MLDNNYAILRGFSAGQSCKVKKAKDLGSGEYVAIKTLNDDVGEEVMDEVLALVNL